jgi:hypothetical protein
LIWSFLKHCERKENTEKEKNRTKQKKYKKAAGQPFGPSQKAAHGPISFSPEAVSPPSPFSL